ncbi:MAG: DUF3899 domain-containing protein [Spirochaetales bacterium]|nr:DUF3899 domain-containing protein [Spirochaetales bacterium]
MRKSAKYLIYATATLVAVFLISVLLGLFSAEGKGGVIKALSDAFFIAGVFEAGVGLLSWAAKQGAYDIFGYAGTVIFLKFRPKKEIPKYYDYVQEKNASRKPWLKELTICGLSCILVAGLILLFEV